MRLVLRADGNSAIGLGHVMRLLALGQAWQDAGGTVVFVSRPLPAAIRERLHAEAFDVVELSGGDEDAAKTAALATGLVVVDGYHFDATYLAALRRSCVVALVDDHANEPRFDVDLIINQNAGATPSMYSGTDARLLLGPTYALMRRDLARDDAAPDSAVHSPARVLVTLGGADSENVTEKIMRALARARSNELAVRVLVGAANVHRSSLEVAARDAAFELRGFTSRMADELEWADVVVSGAGTTCWELCCLGVPCVTLILADNQRIVARGIAAAGAGLDLGWHADIEDENVLAAVRTITMNATLAQEMSAAGRRLVDGNGARRVVQALQAAMAGTSR
jgi:UDP-2,4-diacetamido-2,4,6-trideoxy-beta-L-altropyranose hydrolase